MSDFERIISDSMMAFEACNHVPHEEGFELEDIVWEDEEDTDWDVYGEEEFA